MRTRTPRFATTHNYRSAAWHASATLATSCFRRTIATSAGGCSTRALTTIARDHMGVHHSRVIRDVQTLEKYGIVKVNKPLETRLSKHAGGKRTSWRKRKPRSPEEWKGASPTTRLPSDLQAVDPPRI